MPINLTTVPESGDPSRRPRRRRRHKDKHRLHVIYAGLAGVALLAVVGGFIALSRWDNNTTRTRPLDYAYNPPGDVTPPPAPDEHNRTLDVAPVPAESESEITNGLGKCRLKEAYLKRDGGNQEKVELFYEFDEGVKKPAEYQIAVQNPQTTTGPRYVSLGDAMQSNRVSFSLTKLNLSSIRPIRIWIEPISQSGYRVSNVLAFK